MLQLLLFFCHIQSCPTKHLELSYYDIDSRVQTRPAYNDDRCACIKTRFYLHQTRVVKGVTATTRVLLMLALFGLRVWIDVKTATNAEEYMGHGGLDVVHQVELCTLDRRGKALPTQTATPGRRGDKHHSLLDVLRYAGLLLKHPTRAAATKQQ